jgi:hypothetical protein
VTRLTVPKIMTNPNTSVAILRIAIPPRDGCEASKKNPVTVVWCRANDEKAMKFCAPE